MSKLSTIVGTSLATDPVQAVQELALAIAQPDTSLVIFFCSSKYSLPELEKALAATFSCPVIGCTSAGEIASDSGYTDSGIVGVSLSSPDLIPHPKLISNLSTFNLTKGDYLAKTLRAELQQNQDFNPATMFGFLLVDGLSMQEEKLVAALHNALGNVTIIGGSAADDYAFKSTWVYFEGMFHADAALITLFETTLPFRTFQIHHYQPTPVRLVITESNSDLRIVSEINGFPAVEEYARALGITIEELTPAICAANPLMLKVGDDYYVRGLQKVNADGSLSLYCAIDTGLVLTMGRGNQQPENLESNFAKLRNDLPGLKLILGCDCHSRRLELRQKNGIKEAEKVLKGVNFIGFSTYGEQFNGLHVSQTLTGIAIGEPVQ